MAEDDLLFPGYLYQPGTESTPTGRYPYPYPYATTEKYVARMALYQGTLLPWLDDHWRSVIGRPEDDPR